MIEEGKSLSWPNVVHRLILTQFPVHVVIGRQVIYSSDRGDLYMNIDKDGTIHPESMTIYSNKGETKFIRFFHRIDPGDQSALKVFEFALCGIRNFA
jgi:hypothetical protein